MEDGPGSMLYAVYCTAQIPDELLTRFIRKWQILDFPIIISCKNSHLSDYKTSTRLPVKPFESPFLGLDLEAIVSTYKQQTHGLDSSRYGTGNFVILDNQTLEDGTCLIVNLSYRAGTQVLRSDFDMALHAFDVSDLMEWDFDEGTLGHFYRAGTVVTKQAYDAFTAGDS